jgi:hypothetical protein
LDCLPLKIFLLGLPAPQDISSWTACPLRLRHDLSQVSNYSSYITSQTTPLSYA